MTRTLFITCACLLLLSGCGSFRPDPPVVAPDVSGVEKDITQHVADARQSFADITSHLEVPPAEIDIPGLRISVAVGSAALVNIEREVVDLQLAAKQIEVAIEERDVRIDELEQQVTESERRLEDKQRAVMGWVWGALIAAGVLAAGVGVFLMVTGNRSTGLGVAGGGLVMSVLAGVLPRVLAASGMALSVVAWVVGIVIALLFLFGAALLAHGVWENRGRLLRYDKATGQDAQLKLLGRGDVDGAAACAYANAKGNGSADKAKSRAEAIKSAKSLHESAVSLNDELNR